AGGKLSRRSSNQVFPVQTLSSLAAGILVPSSRAVGLVISLPPPSVGRYPLNGGAGDVFWGTRPDVDSRVALDPSEKTSSDRSTRSWRLLEGRQLLFRRHRSHRCARAVAQEQPADRELSVMPPYSPPRSHTLRKWC